MDPATAQQPNSCTLTLAIAFPTMIVASRPLPECTPSVLQRIAMCAFCRITGEPNQRLIFNHMSIADKHWCHNEESFMPCHCA